MSKSALGRQLEKHAPFITAKKDNERFWKGGGINWNTKSIKADTLDAFRKILENPNLVLPQTNLIGEKVSKPSIHNNPDTLDAFEKTLTVAQRERDIRGLSPKITTIEASES